MMQRVVDDTVLAGFSLLFRVAVFALKRRHLSSSSSEVVVLHSSAKVPSAITAGRDRTARTLATRTV